MSETHVALTKPFSRVHSLSESREGSKVTKPIFSNSAMRYSHRSNPSPHPTNNVERVRVSRIFASFNFV